MVFVAVWCWCLWPFAAGIRYLGLKCQCLSLVAVLILFFLATLCLSCGHVLLACILALAVVLVLVLVVVVVVVGVVVVVVVVVVVGFFFNPPESCFLTPLILF